MAVKIRLSRTGAKKRPHYAIVVADERSPRDGRFIEKLGTFNPLLGKDAEKVVFDNERVQYWLSKGAKPTDRMLRILDSRRPRQASGPPEPEKGAAEEEGAGAHRRRQAEGGRCRRRSRCSGRRSRKRAGRGVSACRPGATKAATMTQPLVVVARIGAPHGVSGEVRVTSFTQEPLAFASYGPLTDGAGRRFEIGDARFAGNRIVARIKGIANRDQAAALTGVEFSWPALSAAGSGRRRLLSCRPDRP